MSVESGVFDCPSCNTLSDIDEVAALGGRCPVCGQYNHDLDAGRHHAAVDDGVGYRTLYHNTTPEAADSIRANGFSPGREKGQRPDAAFFSTHPDSDYIKAFGQGQVSLRVPENMFSDEYGEFGGEGAGWLDDEFPSGEQHWAIPVQHLRNEWIERHHTASTDGIRYARVVEDDVAEDLHRVAMPAAYDSWTPSRHTQLAAVNQDLVDRLKGEFYAWRKQQPKGSIFGGGIIGGLNEWPNIEKFLKDQYPAAHRGLDMGYEEARTLLDHGRMYPQGHPLADSVQGYETGPEAIAQHGYDPKEIAAGMLLLHNKTDRFRGDMSQEDQARLNDIAQKRFQMQRDYEQRQTTAHRIAMPAPLPQGVTFKYHPELVWSPGVTAHLPDGRQVGSLEWYDDDHVMVDLGTRRPGEIDRIQVPEDQRGQSIATSMFDFAKQHEPRLHHSDILTEDGRGWSEYEQSRDKSPMPKRFAMPTVYHGTDPESAQSILQNGFSPGGWGDKSFFSTEPQDAASYGESLLSVDIPDDEWERTERHPWMHHETAEIDPHRLQELGIKPRLLDEVPHRPLTGPPVWPKVYRKNPDQTWQEGRPVDQVARQIDTDDDLTQMRGVPDWPKGAFDAGTGTYWDVDFGDGPTPVHQRDLYT